MAISNGTREAGEWIDLKPVDEAGTLGCLLALAAILLILGGGILAVFLGAPGGKGDAWVMPVVGGAFFLVGAFLLYAAIRGARGRSIPPCALLLQGSLPLRGGAPVRLRLRQPGPVTLESLTVTLTCRREYRRKVRRTSSSTVPDHEILWEQVLLNVGGEAVPAGGALDREIELALPRDAAPTGPALPDGRVAWKIEVAAEAGFMRARHRAFDVRVEGPAAVPTAGLAASEGIAEAGTANEWSSIFNGAEPGDAARPAETPRPRPRQTGSRRAGPGKKSTFGAGCLVIAVPFVLCGAFFLWAFFSGAAFRGRGNPYMALFGGLLFAGFGLLGIVGYALSSIGSRKKR